MIRGKVNGQFEARVSVRVRGPSGIERVFDAMVDTGFTDALSLPAAVIAALGLVRKSGGVVVLADGSSLRSDIYSVELEWDGTWRSALARALGDDPLIGMRLLADHALLVEVKPGGSVVIDRLP